jgi:hypothetical protein
METFFLITVNKDGTLTSYAEMPEELPKAERVATNYDVYQAAKQIADEFEMGLLADRVASKVIATLMPPVTTPADAIKDRLKERGINPESAPVDE